MSNKSHPEVILIQDSDDDDVVVLDPPPLSCATSQTQECPICFQPFDIQDPDFSAHVNAHFDDPVEETVALKSNASSTVSAQSSSDYHSIKDLISWLHCNMTRLYSSNSIPDIRRIKSLILSHPATEFITSLNRDNWTCGYRNLQMLVSCLNKSSPYDQVLKHYDFTSMLSIQSLIEDAWNAGFDVQGASQLNFSVKHSKKWIGTTEVAALFHYIGIRTKIIDVTRPTGPNSSHPVMLKMIRDYFTSLGSGSSSIHESRIRLSDLPPIYVQHQGHSRTIIGYEESETGQENLWLFDPGKRFPSRILQQGNLDEHNFRDLCDFFAVPAQKLSSHSQYSMLVVDGFFADASERERGKVLRSTRIP